MKKFFLLFVSILLATVLFGCQLDTDTKSETDKGVALTVSSKNSLKELRENSDIIVQATVDDNYDISKSVADAENNVYQIDRVYGATIDNELKATEGNKYKKGDKIEIVYPIGIKQFKDDESSQLNQFHDKIIKISSGEYLLFLDKLDNGKLYFANINHVYKKNDKNTFSNISTDKVPEVAIKNIKKK